MTATGVGVALTLAVALLGAAAARGAAACELKLSDARSGRSLGSHALADEGFAVVFRHSVLGTDVVDRYRRVGAHLVLVAEEFEGEGYGLPHAPGAGERIEVQGQRSVIHLARAVDPLIVRPSREHDTRLRSVAGEHRLAALTLEAIRFDVAGCAP